MSDGSIKIQNSTQRIDTQTVTTDVGVVERQVCVIGDPALPNGMAEVDSTTKALKVLDVSASTPRLGNVFATGQLVSNTTTANQVIATYTVPAGRTLRLQGWDCTGRMSNGNNTFRFFGDVSLRVGSSNLMTRSLTGGGVAETEFSLGSNPPEFPAGSVVTVVCTPAVNTSFTWNANLNGYEV